MLYKSADGAAALGRVSQLAADEVSLERLEEDAVNLVWRVSYDAEQRVPLSSVWRKVEADYMQVRGWPHGQAARITRVPLSLTTSLLSACRLLQLCDPDRVSNPHGEHALEVYRLLEPVAEALQAASQAE